MFVILSFYNIIVSTVHQYFWRAQCHIFNCNALNRSKSMLWYAKLSQNCLFLLYWYRTALFFIVGPSNRALRKRLLYPAMAAAFVVAAAAVEGILRKTAAISPTSVAAAPSTVAAGSSPVEAAPSAVATPSVAVPSTVVAPSEAATHCDVMVALSATRDAA